MALFRWLSRLLGLEDVASQLPLPASVEAFDGREGVVSVHTEAGTRANGFKATFTLDDCRLHARGYLPVTGSRVVVRALAQGGGLPRATDVLVLTRSSLEAFLESAEDLSQEGVQWAHDVGIATVLLRSGLEESGAAFKALDLPEDLVLPTMRSGPSPFPTAGIDQRAVGPGFSFGRSYLSFGGGLVAGYGVSLRRVTPATGVDAKQMALVRQDMLAPNMSLAGLLRFSSALEGLATGVILHRAGHTVLDFASWAAAADPAASAQRPSEPWVRLWSDEASVFSEGMDLFNLPDARVLVRGDDRLRDRASAEELVRAACNTMVRENRILNGDVVLAIDGSGYTAKDTGVHVELSPLALLRERFPGRTAPAPAPGRISLAAA